MDRLKTITLLSAVIFYICNFIGVVVMGQLAPRAHHGEHILVLGKALHHGRLDEDFKQRLNKAQRLWEASPHAQVTVSGAHGEARAALAYVANNHWTGEFEATNTLLNLKNSLHASTTVVVSNRYHLARVKIMARSLGRDIIVVAAEDHPLAWSDTGKIALEAAYCSLFQLTYFLRLSMIQKQY